MYPQIMRIVMEPNRNSLNLHNIDFAKNMEICKATHELDTYLKPPSNGKSKCGLSNLCFFLLSVRNLTTKTIISNHSNEICRKKLHILVNSKKLLLALTHRIFTTLLHLKMRVHMWKTCG